MELRTHLKRLLVAFLLLVGLTFLPVVPAGYAFFGPSGGGGGIPFGGKVSTFFCACSGTTELKVGPPKGGLFILTSGSKVFEIGSVSSGDWVVGLAGGGAACVVPTKKGCKVRSTGPAVKIIGSS